MTRLTGLSLAELRERWWHHDGEWAAEAGAFADETVYLEALQSALRVPVSEEDFLRIRGAAMTPWPTSLRAVERAQELGTATLLTNNGPLVARRLSRLAPELVPILGLEHLRASSDYGARKPDPVVYERVLERYGALPEETFFADDLVENVESAAGLGIRAHLFRTPDGLLHAVERAAGPAA